MLAVVCWAVWFCLIWYLLKMLLLGGFCGVVVFRRCSGIDVCVVFGLFCACGLPGLLDLILYSCEWFGVV